MYDPEYTAIVYTAMHVEIDDGTRLLFIGEEQASYFWNVHWDIIGVVSLKVVECGKYSD